MLRTGYSFNTAVGHLDDCISRLVEIKSKFAPICDRLSTFGYNRWAKATAKAGLKPVFGVELAVVPNLHDKKPIADYWRFIAKSDIKDIHELIHLATYNNSKFPSLTYEQALAASGVWKISGERTLLDRVKNVKDFYVGLYPSTPKGLYNEAKKRKLKFVASSDNYFVRPNDLEFYRVGLGRHAGTQLWSQWILSDAELIDTLSFIAPKKDVLDAMKNRNTILSSAKAQLKKATLLKPEVNKTLREMCIDGAKKKNVNLHDQVYRDRLDKELRLIAEKKFEDYFFIIADMVQWAKQHMVVGPARGSSCGSLVCYLLDITAIDPIPFNLIFERFIDTTRSDLPDIDLDFSDENRQKVFDYVENKYGSERVARLGTVGLFKPRSALKGAGAALRIPGWRIEKVLDNIIERSSGDSRALQQLEDTLNDTEAGRALRDEFPEITIAGRMEGHPHNASQHAAGIVITQEPVTEYVAVDARTKAAMCDKKDAEDLNLLKIDALGLTQLSIFERCLDLIGIKKKQNEWLDALPLDDEEAFDVLNRGHFSGIFQFMGIALQSLTKQTTISHIEDIISITALARPGPLATGGANSWVRRKNGKEPITYPHPLFEPFLSGTLGIVIYQEQVMQIGREIGDLSWEQVTALRKAMSRSLGAEYFNQYGDPWKKAAAKKGIPQATLDKVWDDLCAYGSWSFNRSHAVAYGKVSYYCCYLKAHYPLEFAAATLDAESDPARQISLLRELRSEGIDYVAVDPQHSTNRWMPVEKDGKKILVGPLTSIKGVGPATVREILDARQNGLEVRNTVLKKLAIAKTDIDTLFPIEDAVKRKWPNGLREAKIVTPQTSIINVQCGVNGEVLIVGIAQKIVPRDANEEVYIAKRGGRKMSGQTKFLNLFFRDDTDEIYCKIDRYNFHNMALDVIERGRPGKSIYAVKGTVPKDFRMISIRNIRYLGDIDD